MIGRPTVVAGLDVGSTKTCAVIAELPADRNGRGRIRILGLGLASSRGIRERGVTDLEATTGSIRDALEEAELMAGEEVERVFVGISGPHVRKEGSTGVVAVGGEEIVESDVKRVHEVAQAVVVPPDRELLHAIPQGYVVDGRPGIHHPVGMAATRLETEVAIITAETAPCRNLRRAVDRAGYGVEEVVLESLASSLAVLDEKNREMGVALVEVGGRSTNLAVYREGRLEHLTTLPWGSLTVSNDVVKGLGIPATEAERLKEEHGAARTELVDPGEKIEVSGPTPGSTRSVSRELLAHIIEQRMDEMFGLVYEELAETRLLSGLGAGIVLTGGGISVPGTVELAQSVFNTQVRVGEPGEGLSGLRDAVRKSRFATAVGLSIYGCQRRREQGAGRAVAAEALAQVSEWLREFF